MTVIYVISYHGDEDEIAFPTLREARRFRTVNYDRGDLPEIVRYKIGKMPKREMLCALFNRRGFAAAQDVVSTSNE